MSRVLVVCEDAGGARALGPVVRRMVGRGDSVSAWLGETAERIFRADSVAVDRASSPEVGAADLVLTSSTCWGLRLEARAIREATERAIPTLTVVDFWARYLERLSFPGDADLGALPVRLSVIDAMMRDDLVALGVPGERIVITGSPAFDASLADPLPPVPAGRPRIVFVSQPIAALWGNERGYTEVSVLETLAPMVHARQGTLVIRPHPREDREQLARLITTLPCEARIDDGPSLRAVLSDAAVVVGLTSVALVEAALAGRVAISAQLGRRVPDELPTNRSGLTIPVLDPPALERELESALASRQRTSSAATTEAARAAFPRDATSNVVAVADTLLRAAQSRVAPSAAQTHPPE